MMKHLRLFIWLSCVTLVCISCDEGRDLPSATGSIYECLVVMPKANSPLYDSVQAVMAAPMPALPQAEPYFRLSHIAAVNFDACLKASRNILEIEIDARYTEVKVKKMVDEWAHPQAVYHVHAPSAECFAQFWSEKGTTVRDWFVRQELSRQISFHKTACNTEARKQLLDRFDCDAVIPMDYQLIMDTTVKVGSIAVPLQWFCNYKGRVRSDIVVYSYPYTSQDMFSLEQLNIMRDTVLGQVVTASEVNGSYMGTEYRYDPPQIRSVCALSDSIPANTFYANEIRGLWKMRGGEAMGGPFVSLSRLDLVNARVITAEAFLYGPNQNKRNPLRQAEAVLYSLQLPEDRKAW